MSLFNTKFFRREAKFSLTELDRTKQYPEGDLDLYVKSFHERAIDCRDLVDEEVLINICLYGMLEEYRIFLENLSFLFYKNDGSS